MISAINLDKEGQHERLIENKIIGQGSFGFVKHCTWNGRDVATKLFVGEIRSFIAELNNLIKVNHENIIKCLAYKTSERLIVMEFAENGSLNQLLHSPRYSNVGYNLAHSLNWALQCAKGVQYLHSFQPKAIIHRDLKPHNILLMNDFTLIKICDFNTACHTRSIMTSLQGTIPWMSPEVMKGERYNEKCDIFSWATILWELFSRQVPHSTSYVDSNERIDDDNEQQQTNGSTNCTRNSISPIAVMMQIANGKRPKLLKNCPKVFEDLIVACWSTIPEERPSMNEVVEQLELYYKIVKKHATPIDPSKIIPEDVDSSLNLNRQDVKIDNDKNKKNSNLTYIGKMLKIPDNVNLKPHCERVINQADEENETPVYKRILEFAPTSIEEVNKKDNNSLEIIKLEKLDNDKENDNLKFVSTIETQISQVSSDSDYYGNDYDATELTNGCIAGIGTISKMVSEILYKQPLSQSTFYVEEEINELDSKFSTLTPSLNDHHQSSKINKNLFNNNEYTKIITKHTAKNHRSEIEINNCKQLNSSASSTISSSSISVVNEKNSKDLNSNELINDQKAAFRSNEDVNNFFNNSNKYDDNDICETALESSDDLNKLDSSFESIDKGQIESLPKQLSLFLTIFVKFTLIL